MLCKKNENLEFVQSVNVYFLDSLKNNSTKNWIFSDNSCEEICNSKAFVDIATARKHRGLNAIYIKRNLIHRSQLRRHVELQDTHIVLLKSPSDVMQSRTPSAQLWLGSEVVDWYRDAILVPWGHLLVDLSPLTVDRIRYCTNTG